VFDANTLSYCYRSMIAPKEPCFFQLDNQNLSSIYVELFFKSNSVDAAGSVLYGGTVYNCKLNNLPHSYSSGKLFDVLVQNNDTGNNTTSIISSEPFMYAYVFITFQTVVRLGMDLLQLIQVKHFKFLWLQLGKEMEQFLAQ